MGPFFLLKVCLIFTHMPNKTSLILFSPLIRDMLSRPPLPPPPFCLSFRLVPPQPVCFLVLVSFLLTKHYRAPLSCLIGPRGLIWHLIKKLVFVLLNFQGRVLPLDNFPISQGYVVAHISLNCTNNSPLL